nr:MAG TPA: hypothetical protein [Caudoviricetes sp.]
MHHLQQFDAHAYRRSVRGSTGDGEGLVGVGNGSRITGVFLCGLFALFGLGLTVCRLMGAVLRVPLDEFGFVPAGSRCRFASLGVGLAGLGGIFACLGFGLALFGGFGRGHRYLPYRQHILQPLGNIFSHLHAVYSLPHSFYGGLHLLYDLVKIHPIITLLLQKVHFEFLPYTVQVADSANDLVFQHRRQVSDGPLTPGKRGAGQPKGKVLIVRGVQRKAHLGAYHPHIKAVGVAQDVGPQQIPQLVHLFPHVLPVKGPDGQGGFCLLLVLGQLLTGGRTQGTVAGGLAIHINMPGAQAVPLDRQRILRCAGDGVVTDLLKDPPALLHRGDAVGRYAVYKIRTALLIQHKVQHVHTVLDALRSAGYVLRFQIIVVEKVVLGARVISQPKPQISLVLVQQIGAQDAPQAAELVAAVAGVHVPVGHRHLAPHHAVGRVLTLPALVGIHYDRKQTGFRAAVVRAGRESGVDLPQLVQDAVRCHRLVQIELQLALRHTAKEDALAVLLHHDPGAAHHKVVVVRVLHPAKAGLCLIRHPTRKASCRFVLQLNAGVCHDALGLFALHRVAVRVVHQHLFRPVEPGRAAVGKLHRYLTGIYLISHFEISPLQVRRPVVDAHRGVLLSLHHHHTAVGVQRSTHDANVGLHVGLQHSALTGVKPDEPAEQLKAAAVRCQRRSPCAKVEVVVLCQGILGDVGGVYLAGSLHHDLVGGVLGKLSAQICRQLDMRLRQNIHCAGNGHRSTGHQYAGSFLPDGYRSCPGTYRTHSKVQPHNGDVVLLCHQRHHKGLQPAFVAGTPGAIALQVVKAGRGHGLLAQQGVVHSILILHVRGCRAAAGHKHGTGLVRKYQWKRLSRPGRQGHAVHLHGGQVGLKAKGVPQPVVSVLCQQVLVGVQPVLQGDLGMVVLLAGSLAHPDASHPVKKRVVVQNDPRLERPGHLFLQPGHNILVRQVSHRPPEVVFLSPPVGVYVELPVSFPVTEHRVPCQSVAQVSHAAHALHFKGHGLFRRRLHDRPTNRDQIKIPPGMCVTNGDPMWYRLHLVPLSRSFGRCKAVADHGLDPAVRVGGIAAYPASPPVARNVSFSVRHVHQHSPTLQVVQQGVVSGKPCAVCHHPSIGFFPVDVSVTVPEGVALAVRFIVKCPAPLSILEHPLLQRGIFNGAVPGSCFQGADLLLKGSHRQRVCRDQHQLVGAEALHRSFGGDMEGQPGVQLCPFRGHVSANTHPYRPLSASSPRAVFMSVLISPTSFRLFITTFMPATALATPSIRSPMLWIASTTSRFPLADRASGSLGSAFPF